MTLPEITGFINERAVLRTVVRHGLGHWQTFALSIGPFAAIIAAPKDDMLAGCSIWTKSAVDPAQFAAMLRLAVNREDVQFLDPDTGTLVTPDTLDHDSVAAAQIARTQGISMEALTRD